MNIATLLRENQKRLSEIYTELSQCRERHETATLQKIYSEHSVQSATMATFFYPLIRETGIHGRQIAADALRNDEAITRAFIHLFKTPQSDQHHRRLLYHLGHFIDHRDQLLTANILPFLESSIDQDKLRRLAERLQIAQKIIPQELTSPFRHADRLVIAWEQR